MALRIQRRSWKNQDGSVSNSWRLIVDVYTGSDVTSEYPPKAKYASYGLNPDDTYEVAVEKLKVVRASREIVRRRMRQAKVEKRIKADALKESAYLPNSIYLHFVEWLKNRRMWDEVPEKEQSRLRTMRKCILEMGACPSTWPDKPELIYKWFRSQSLSVSSVEKLIPLLNDYGYFYCREFRKPFLKIPPPRGDVLRRIEDANLDKRGGKTNTSNPLTAELLTKLEDLREDQFRWMRLSFWFGLRPEEVDSLKPRNQTRNWKITTDSNKIAILHVYQTKLVKIERARRWKRIPAILPEQRKLIKELESELPANRPIVKTIRHRLGDGFGVYAGRKGFEKLMRAYGQDDRNVSRWLGHQDINRTETNYRELEAVSYIIPTAKVLRLAAQSLSDDT